MAFIKETLNEETIFRDSRVRFRVLKSGKSYQSTLFKDQCGGGRLEESNAFVAAGNNNMSVQLKIENPTENSPKPPRFYSISQRKNGNIWQIVLRPYLKE